MQKPMKKQGGGGYTADEKLAELDPKNNVINLRKSKHILALSLMIMLLSIIVFTLAFTYSALSQSKTASGVVTFAINGHEGTFDIDYGSITNYNTSSDSQTIFKFTAQENYEAPESITITQNGSAFSGYTYSYSGQVGTITINNFLVQNTLAISAVCRGKAVTISLNTGSGTTNVTAHYLEAMPSITKPSKLHYDFQGYYTEQNGSGQQIYNANCVSNLDKCLYVSATTLYAHFTLTVYTITYELNGGSWVTSAQSTYTYGSSITLPTDMIKDDYTFVKWTTTNDANATAVTGISATDSGNKTFYAIWEESNCYVVTIVLGGNFQVVSSDTQYDIAVTQPSGETGIGTIDSIANKQVNIPYGSKLWIYVSTDGGGVSELYVKDEENNIIFSELVYEKQWVGIAITKSGTITIEMM